jgi:sarcosine oxidase subunit gamma
MPRIVSMLEPTMRFSLRLRPDTAAELRNAAGFQLDASINTCVVAGARTSARLGPDEWLLLGPEAQSETLAQELDSALAGRFFSLVDISHRNVAITVAGARAREVINGGCPLDLHDEVFLPGRATRTLLGKAEIVLLRPGAQRLYRVECWRSFAPYVLAFLQDVAREHAD